MRRAAGMAASAVPRGGIRAWRVPSRRATRAREHARPSGSMSPMSTSTDIHALLGADADALLGHTAKAFPAEHLTLPGPDYLDRVFTDSDRNPTVLRNLGTMFNHGRLGGTGYLSILPVDQGIEHSAAASFSKNPAYFDPLNIIELALAGECNAVATTLGTLGLASRKYVHRIPFICKLNHNAFLHVPNTYDQITFGSVSQAFDLGAVGVGATIYFGSDDMDRELQQVSEAFAEAHQLGMFTVLWCYLRNPAFTKDGVNYEVSADLTGQANHMGVTIEADIIKQKQPENNGGYTAVGFGRTDPLVYDELTTDNLIDLTRWQVVNCYAGRIGLINSGGESKGDSDLAQAARTAVINKRAGGMGLIVGRKAFQRPLAEGAALIHTVQDVYLNDEVTIA
jgi:fructose-bisphosphate aldolase, class I